jgi:FAD/FMN-containing dehydrogenase
MASPLDGQFRRTSATQYPDLFWALRGGGGNFGVVTALEFRLHPVTVVLGGLVLHPLQRASDMLRFYRDFCATLPDAAEAYAALLTSPEGVPMAAMLLGHNGPIEEGERVLAPGRQFGQPVADLVAPMSYGDRRHGLQHRCRGPDPWWRVGLANGQVWGIRGQSAFRGGCYRRKIMVEGAARFSSPLSQLFLFYMHGAVTRVPASDTAFGARRSHWDFDAIGQWSDGAESVGHIAWVRELWSRLEPHLQGSAYVNHISADDQPEKIRASFGTNYQRLRAIKAEYDKANQFRVNCNIAPT